MDVLVLHVGCAKIAQIYSKDLYFLALFGKYFYS